MLNGIHLLRKPGYTRRAGQANTRVVPALALDAPYLSRLSARSALYTELRLLLDANYESLSSEEYCARVLEENCLARASMAARKKLWKELKSRYLLDREQPLFAAFWRSGGSASQSLNVGLRPIFSWRLMIDWSLTSVRSGSLDTYGGLRQSCAPRMFGTSLNTLC